MKQYNNENGIISLTSHKSRINTCSKTIFSLLEKCPSFHIVLVLSEEEFPEKEKELPETIIAFIQNNLIEILWVYKNVKSFKKWIFTAKKYKDIPIISADDDCIYTCNYAQNLLNKLNEKREPCFIRYCGNGKRYIPQGPCTLYFIKYDDIINAIISILYLDKTTINKSFDDNFFGEFFKKLNYPIYTLNHNWKRPLVFHDRINPIHH